MRFLARGRPERIPAVRLWRAWRARYPVGIALGVVIGVSSPSAIAQAQCRGKDAHILFGRVLSVTGEAIPQALVVVRDATNCGHNAAHTDSVGRFRTSMRGGSGVYDIAVSRIGFAPQIARSASATAAREIVVRLTPISASLPVVQTVATRPRVFRDEAGVLATPGTSEVNLSPSGSAVGESAHLLALLSGLSVTASGNGALDVGAFGLPADENATVMNGATFGNTELPRVGLRKTARLGTYDPKYGIAGVQVNAFLGAGNRTPARAVVLTDEEPVAPLSGNGLDAFTLKSRRRGVSVTASGPLTGRGVFYSAVAQLDHSTRPIRSLTTSSDGSLAALGISPDSVRRLESIAESIGLPLQPSLSTPALQNDWRSLGMMRVDLNSAAAEPLSKDGSVAYLLLSSAWSRATLGGMSPSAALTRMRTAERREATVALHYAPYLWSALTETVLAASSVEQREAPTFVAPSAVVTVAGVGEGGGQQPLLLGGGDAVSQVREQRVLLTNETSWMTWDRAHRFALYVEGSANRRVTHSQRGVQGEFTYRTLDELERATPIEFSRVLDRSNAGAEVWRGVIGVSDVYRVHQRARAADLPFEGDGLKLQYGLRLQAERGVPSDSPSDTVLALFSRRISTSVKALSINPMIGITWRIGTLTAQRGPLRITESKHQIVGGIRQYTGGLSPPSLAAAAAQTGSQNGQGSIRCIGRDVPMPDWHGFTEGSSPVPASCTRGSGREAGLSYPVLSYGPDYTPFRSQRVELSWKWMARSKIRTTLGGNLVANRFLSGVYDLNFAGKPGFRIASEENRPVFALPSDIDASSGLSSVTTARTLPLYSRVAELRSDYRSQQRQLTASLGFNSAGIIPARIASSAALVVTGQITYSNTHGTRTSRGFDGSTAGDPRVLEVTPLPTPRHTFQGGLTISKDGWGELDLSARLQSGMGVTPLVDGDVNADGLANDRAYIPRIDELSGREAEDWHALLAAAPSWARQCLERSQGRIVAPNACRAPWVFQVGLLSIRPDPYRIGLGDRGALTLHLDNIANAVDRIAHRGRSHGWGTLGIPDPVLLRIREFDPTDSHFMYRTNARFGTDNSRFLSDQGFRAILELRVELGPNPENAAVRQLLRTFAVDIDAHDTDNVKRRLLALAGPTPWSLLRAGARYLPWLQLTTAQREALSELGQRQAARRDSIYSALADLFASGNRQLNSREVRAQWHTAMTASLALNHEFIRSARELLSPEQLAHAEQRGLLPMPFSPEELRRRARAPFILPQ